VAYEVIIAPSAFRDLEEVFNFIATDSPENASRFVRLLLDSTRKLGDFPELGRIVPNFKNPLIRELVVRSYRVIYRLDPLDERVEIVRFWHAARGTPRMDL
jgi:plasmid stabilization system protein ParE